MVCGVYFLSVGGKYYIGRSKDIEARLATHTELILAGTHPNTKIMEAYNPTEGIKQGIVEVCSEEDSLAAEMYWIDEYDAVNRGLNRMPSGIKELPVFVSPEGTKVYGYTQAKLCREYGLDPGSISRMVSKKKGSHKGWKLSV